DGCSQPWLGGYRRPRPRTRKSPRQWAGALHVRNRRRPTLPGRLRPSTIGAGGLNFRVRNGNGCLTAAITTETSALRRVYDPRELHSEHEHLRSEPSPRPISTGRLNTLQCVHLRPINVV